MEWAVYLLTGFPSPALRAVAMASMRRIGPPDACAQRRSRGRCQTAIQRGPVGTCPGQTVVHFGGTGDQLAR
jgi:hypothetical protein